MKITSVKFEEPKNKQAALNLCAYIQGQVEAYQKKGANLVTSKTNTEKKILKLQETLAKLEQQISSVSTNEKNWKSKLEFLQTEHSLTAAEILETKSELLRRQISSLQKSASVEEEGEPDLI